MKNNKKCKKNAWNDKVAVFIPKWPPVTPWWNMLKILERLRIYSGIILSDEQTL